MVKPGPVGPHQQLAVAVRAGADEIVGISSSLVTCSAAADGTISSTTANAPASSTAWASSSSCCDAVAAALDDVPAEAVLALRGEADVRHHRDAGAHDALDLLGAALAALAA